jgi:3',5'-cyclic AMP phosphodiesterase CpdA
MRRFLIPAALGLFLAIAPAAHPSAQTVTLGQIDGALKVAVIGDNGTGERPQYDVADRMWAAHAEFPYDTVLMMGDNLYGRQQPEDFVLKFEKPYGALIAAGVRFYAALGNHDRPDNRFYPAFNMNGERYYTFTRGQVRFVVLDTNVMDPRQLAWADQTLGAATEPWKIMIFHHPLYSDGGRHGSNVELRVAIEPILLRHGVRVVLGGHDHFYGRSLPQHGITHFVVGSSGQLRKGDARRSAIAASSFDQDQAFMLMEIGAEELRFQTISRTGVTVDRGVISRRPTT